MTTRQSQLVDMMRRFDDDPYADPQQVRACIDEMTPEGLRAFNYDYFLINMLTVFGRRLDRDLIDELALRAARFRLWTRWERYSEPIALGMADVPRLRGWDRNMVGSLLERGKGLVIYTGHFGAYWYIQSDLRALGYRKTWFCADRLAAERLVSLNSILRSTLAKRLAGIKGYESEEAIALEIERLLDDPYVINVEDPMASLGIAKRLRNNEIVIVFVDGNTGSDGNRGVSNRIPLDYLGWPVDVKYGMAKIAAASGAPILPLLTRRLGSTGEYRLHEEWVGEVTPFRPMIFGEPSSASISEQFAQDAVKSLMRHLEDAIQDDPEQWIGASLYHRMRPAPSKAVSDGALETQSERRPEPERIFANGRRLRLNPTQAVHIPTDLGPTLVDVRSLKVVKLRPDLRDLASALEGKEGVGEEYCTVAAGNPLRAQDVRQSLTMLEQLGLLTDH